MTARQNVKEPGLPHGRLWVAEDGCECGACARRRADAEAEALARLRDVEGEERRQDRIARGLKPEPRPWSRQVTFVLTRRHGWAVRGPAEDVHLGLVTARNVTTGRTSQVYVHRLGKLFTDDGIVQRYGYIRR